MFGPIASTSLRVGFDTLRGNPLRTALSTLGIIMGVGALVSVLSLGDGMERFARDQIAGTTDLHGISVTPVLSRTVDGQRFPRADIVQFVREDVDSVQAAAGPTAVATLFVSGHALVTTRADTTPVVVRVAGALASVEPELPAPVAHGRFFTDAEVRADAPVVVISDSLAKRLTRTTSVASVLGDSIVVRDSPWEVIGILGPERARPSVMALMPLGAARELLPGPPIGPSTTIRVRASRVEEVPVIRGRIESLMARRYGTSWEEQVRVGTDEARVAQVQQAILVFKLFMGAITGISLLVGGIGIMNVLLASVIERTREIGIRKAVGARQRHILLQFLAEAVTITSFGSIIGVVLGIGAAFGATAVMRRMTSAEVYAGFSFSTLLVAMLAAVVIGVASGLYPALRAARLAPIDAIHHE